MIQFLLFVSALSLQMLLIPLIGKNFFLANSLLCLSIVFSLKEGRIESILWGAFLGGLTDLLLFQHIGFYGISFVISSYLLGLLSHKMVISGVFPIVLISILSFITVVLVAVLLMTLFLGKVDLVLILNPFVLGVLFTPILTLLFEFIYRKAENLVQKR
ncbi:MAG: hypothetical protein N2445_02490 [Acidobacteria bacterium]|nr:hypothetical protein [Acidobacteriota bacterium]